LERVKCSQCGEQAADWDESSESVPPCPLCGGFLRPDVVWFGESLPPEVLDAAVKATRVSQVFLSIGTSGLVHPAASLALAARERGAVIVEINAEPTPLTPRADFFFAGRSGEILPALRRAVWG
jgi:NAD-dependent deacetylase